MGVQAGVFGQERGVDVQHAAAEPLHERRGQHPHEAREAQNIGRHREDRAQQLRLECGPLALEGAVIDRRGRNSKRRGPRQPCRRGVAGHHQHRACRVIAAHAFDQFEHVRAAARNQDCDAFHSRWPR